MSSVRLTSRAARLLDHHRHRGHAYPKPRYWERLYQMLQEEAEKRGRTPPPPPRSSALDHEPTLDDMVECLREQVAWADRNQLLHRIQDFFDHLPPSCWERFDGR